MSLPLQGPNVTGRPSIVRGQVSPRCFGTGGVTLTNTADGTDYTGVATEIIVAELPVPFPTTVTGVALKVGSTGTFSDNVKVGLYDSLGNLLYASASTAGGSQTADTYMRIPFATEFVSTGAAVTIAGTVALQPGTYYIAAMLDGTTAHINTHVQGSFGAGKITGQVYSTAMSTTALTLTLPTTFTTALGPIATLY